MKKGDYFCVEDFIFLRGEIEEYTVFYNDEDVAGLRIENGRIILDFNGEDKVIGLIDGTEFADSHAAYDLMKYAVKVLKEEYFPSKGK